jgi:hypothetical protein
MAAIVKRTDRITETSTEDEIVVMRVDSGTFFSLSGTAAITWLLIDGTRDRDMIIRELAEKYAADETCIAADVDQFLSELRDSGLLGDA